MCAHRTGQFPPRMCMTAIAHGSCPIPPQITRMDSYCPDCKMAMNIAPKSPLDRPVVIGVGFMHPGPPSRAHNLQRVQRVDVRRPSQEPEKEVEGSGCCIVM